MLRSIAKETILTGNLINFRWLNQMGLAAMSSHIVTKTASLHGKFLFVVYILQFYSALVSFTFLCCTVYFADAIGRFRVLFSIVWCQTRFYSASVLSEIWLEAYWLIEEICKEGKGEKGAESAEFHRKYSVFSEQRQQRTAHQRPAQIGWKILQFFTFYTMIGTSSLLWFYRVLSVKVQLLVVIFSVFVIEEYFTRSYNFGIHAINLIFVLS